MEFFKHIVFQTINPLEQKLARRQQADRLNRSWNHSIKMSNRVQHWTAILEFFKHHLPNHLSSWAETWWERSGKINSEWLEQFFSYIKEWHPLVIHLENLQTTYFVVICSLQCCRLSEIVWDCGNSWSCLLVFCRGSLGQWNRWAV